MKRLIQYIEPSTLEVEGKELSTNVIFGKELSENISIKFLNDFLSKIKKFGYNTNDKGLNIDNRIVNELYDEYGEKKIIELCNNIINYYLEKINSNSEFDYNYFKTFYKFISGIYKKLLGYSNIHAEIKNSEKNLNFFVVLTRKYYEIELIRVKNILSTQNLETVVSATNIIFTEKVLNGAEENCINFDSSLKEKLSSLKNLQMKKKMKEKMNKRNQKG